MYSWTHPTITTFVAAIVFILIESWFSWRYLQQLKRNYIRLWEESGRRTIWTDGDLISAWPTIRFLWTRGYEENCSSDEEMQFFEKYRIPVVVSWALALVTALLSLASIFIFGWPLNF